MSTLPKFTMNQLFEAGVHYGHKTMRWNPKMAPYIFGAHNSIHIIDLQKTVPLLHNALQVARDVSARNGRILFVATKRQASGVVAESAERCGQYYVNHRWLGGMLTNWGTVSESIKTLKTLQEQLENQDISINKKERLQIERRIEKLERTLGGIKNMGGVPDLLFVIDTNKEHIAIQEANKLGIPVIAIVDTNSNPDNVDHIIPGNDDATRSIETYCQLFADSILGGLQQGVANSNKDAGASTTGGVTKEEAATEETPAEAKTEKAPAKKAPAKKAPAKKATEAKAEKPAKEEAAK